MFCQVKIKAEKLQKSNLKKSLEITFFYYFKTFPFFLERVKLVKRMKIYQQCKIQLLLITQKQKRKTKAKWYI